MQTDTTPKNDLFLVTSCQKNLLLACYSFSLTRRDPQKGPFFRTWNVLYLELFWKFARTMGFLYIYEIKP